MRRRYNRLRGYPAVKVHPAIVARENMFIRKLPSEYVADAECFLKAVDLPLPDQLDANALVSMDDDALRHVDDYLELVHLKVAARTDDDALRLLRNLIAYSGAYAGEVLLKRVSGAIWLTPNDLEQNHAATLTQIGGGIDGRLAGVIFAPGNGTYAFPYAKVHKFLMNGREDSLLGFSRVMAETLNKSESEPAL